MHKPPVPPLVYSRLFPSPKAGDPTTLQAHITRNLVPEVRAETVCFYGPIDCLEAQYPGLDYAKPAHRLRLGRYPWHRRLFRVFDDLRLTDPEIQALCRWEGTRWARERYENDEGVKIRDTTFDDVKPWVAPAPTATKVELRGGEEWEVELETNMASDAASEDEDEEMEDSEVENQDEESEDELQQSVGVELNQRLLAATEARARGEEVVLDADWEQWLKEAAERGAIPEIPRLHGADSSQNPTERPEPYGQIIPEIFRSHQQPVALDPSNLSALQARVSPPPFLPLAIHRSSLPNTSSAPPAGTAM